MICLFSQITKWQKAYALSDSKVAKGICISPLCFYRDHSAICTDWRVVKGNIIYSIKTIIRETRVQHSSCQVSDVANGLGTEAA